MPVPPQFSDLGKKAKDLLSKKYDYKTEIKSTRKAAAGIIVETGATNGKVLDTYLKGNYKCKDFGEFEAEIHTAAGPSSTKAKLKLTKLLSGATVTLSGSSVPSGNVEVQYKQDSLATLLKLDHSDKGTSLGLNVSAGMGGIAAGISTDFDVSAGALNDYNFGLQVTHGDIIASAKTAKQRQDVHLGLHHSYCKGLNLATAVVLNTSDFSQSLTAGFDKTLDANTSAKGRVTSAGVLGLAVEHKLPDPSMKFAVCGEFDAANGFASKKFGISAHFGDY